MNLTKENYKIVYLIGLSLIFVLNDFLFIFVKSYIGWLLVDYGSRVLAISIIAYLITSKRASFSDFGLVKLKIKPFIFWTIILSITGIFVDQVVSQFLAKALPPTQIFYFPKITNHFVKTFDLTFGIFLVSITEEPIFRGYYASILRPYIKNPITFVVISSIIFGLIHWSSGLDTIISAALWGVLPMISVLKTRSILPALIAHYATDFVYFFK